MQDLDSKVDVYGINNGDTVFVGSKAAEAAAAAAANAQKEAEAMAARAVRELQEQREREAAAAEQKRRDAQAIEQAIPQLNALFEKALQHLTPSGAHMTSSRGGGAAAAANFVEDVRELDELLQGLCEKTEALVARVPQLKSVEKVVEPWLQRLLEAINSNRAQSSPLWLDDATPSTRSSFNRCLPIF